MLANLLEQNKAWAEKVAKEDPTFFEELSKQQNPEYLWIGCSDSRVPANQIIGLPPGQVFVHRNVANLVVASDLNCLSVIQYAVFNLGVKHVIVCGHYGCGGVQAAYETNNHGLVDNWLGHIKKMIRHKESDLVNVPEAERVNKLCEMNVMEQVANVGHTTVIQAAWNHGKKVAVHGWIYGLKDGKLSNLEVSVHDNEELVALDKKLT
ncbi:MAG: carbonate dehydratase [Lentisphaeraceae bacterium]|nr:carbonate dehydratase [Lentisphaeraceae bacterium]